MRPVFFLLLATIAQAAPPTVAKVEPPNWWVRHTLSPVQLLLTGEGLQGATVATSVKGLKVETRRVSENGHYLFAYLTIDPSVRPGKYRFDVKSASGAASFDFTLDAPLDPKGRFQGFSSDDVIYLVMPDRFANGDPSNDALPGIGRPANPSDPRALHGGDLRGIRDHLGYLKDLGVTGIWMTPVYRNSLEGYDAYHGYHTVDFYAVEPRYGTMQDFRALVDEAHRMGLKVVQDQVANHSGPRHPHLADPPTPTWWHGADRRPRLRNNFDIAGLADPYARPKRRELPLDGWFAGNLPDLNQEDPLCADYIIQNALWWVGETGIDAIRQDTYPYVDRPFWEKWQTAIDRQYPNLVVTGEITAPNPGALSFFEGGTRRRGVDTKLKSMLDFPLESAVRKVFAQGQPMSLLTDILSQDGLYEHPERLVVFPGNHDQQRFLNVAGGDLAKLRMATAFVLTTNRVVHLYYGDEIAMAGGNDPDNRRDFPAAAFTSRSGDAATMFDATRALLHFRAEHPALRHGSMTSLLSNKDQYACLRTSAEEQVLVVLNRAGTPVELEVDDLPLADGVRLASYDGGAELTVSARKIAVPAREIGIFWVKK
jgi:glycosidase